MIALGNVHPGSTLYIPFETFAGATGAPITMSGFSTADIKIYKDGGTTERASTSGFILLDTDGTDFDGITGIQGFSIDLADNTTADFYKNGSKYFVVISTVTVDGQTMSFIAAYFRIAYENAFLSTFIATLSSQTSFTLSAGPAEDNALKGMQVIVQNAASGVQKTICVISAYTGSTKTVTLAAAPTFTAAAGDNIAVLNLAPLQPTTPGRTAAIDSSGRVDLGLWVGSAPSSLISGRLDCIIGGVTASAITSGAFAPNALDAVWSTSTRVLTAGTNIALAKGTGVTGFNDIAATAIVSSGAITTSGGAVTTTTNLTNAPPDSSGVTTLLSRLPAAFFSGITSLAQWLGMIGGKQTPNSTAQTEMRATGAGSGTFDATTDSTEALRDRGDAAWTTGSAAPTAPAIRAEIDSNSTQLAKLGTPVGASLAVDIAGVPAALLDLANGVETGLTLRQAMRLIAAAEAGQLSGAATTTIVIKAAGVPGTTRITATVDSDGNRSALTLNP